MRSSKYRGCFFTFEGLYFNTFSLSKQLPGQDVIMTKAITIADKTKIRGEKTLSKAVMIGLPEPFVTFLLTE